MLLSFLPPSHMVVPERILVNTIFPFDISIQSNLQEPSSNMATDMEVNTPRGQSTTSSTNSSRATSVHSDVFSTACAEHIQALSNNPTWADQIEISKSEEPALFYVTPKVGKLTLLTRLQQLKTFQNLMVWLQTTCVNLKVLNLLLFCILSTNLWTHNCGMVVFALFPFLELMNIWKAMPRISLVHFIGW